VASTDPAEGDGEENEGEEEEEDGDEGRATEFEKATCAESAGRPRPSRSSRTT
jgi:hypothetical protein